MTDAEMTGWIDVPVTGRHGCLPARLHGSDGAPARAILRPPGSPGRAVSAEAAP